MTNPWKLTAIGLGLVTITAVVTGLVVGGWHRGSSDTPSASPQTDAPLSPGAKMAPGRAPGSELEVPKTPAPAARASTESAPAVTSAPPVASAPPVRRTSGVPPQSVVDACNRYAANQSGGSAATTKDKTVEILKDAAIGAVGGAAVGAGGGAIADGGKGAGKGAAIGGAVGAGAGTLYGIYHNKKNDERYRAAYSSCMHSRGYTVAAQK